MNTEIIEQKINEQADKRIKKIKKQILELIGPYTKSDSKTARSRTGNPYRAKE